MSRQAPESLRRPPVEAVDRRNGDVVVRLVGEIDLYNAAEVGTALEDVAREQPARVVVDLAEVEFVDSTAIGTLIQARKQVGNGNLVLAAPAPQVRRAFEVAGLIDHFPVHDSVDDALA